mmetsp:Transcript_58341/g.185945  ORF Transcript_58341/g.185945 Transcript_58341/m.185945 type:complete len:193 (-) Transcript_58341:18-596(-)
MSGAPRHCASTCWLRGTPCSCSGPKEGPGDRSLGTAAAAAMAERRREKKIRQDQEWLEAEAREVAAQAREKLIARKSPSPPGSPSPPAVERTLGGRPAVLATVQRKKGAVGHTPAYVMRVCGSGEAVVELEARRRHRTSTSFDVCCHLLPPPAAAANAPAQAWVGRLRANRLGTGRVEVSKYNLGQRSPNKI